MIFSSRPWQGLVNVADLWKDDEMPFDNKRDLIVGRIKSLPQYVEDQESDEFDEALWLIVDEMSGVEEEDEFDYVWDSFYDWCDAERIWVVGV